MRCALIGPICKDSIIHRKLITQMPGGGAFYTGKALQTLGVDVDLYVISDYRISEDVKRMFTSNIHIIKESTMHFTNIYSKNHIRKQQIETKNPIISKKEINRIHLEKYDYVIMSPLFHTDFKDDAIEMLEGIRDKVILSLQGALRHLNTEKQVFMKKTEKLEKYIRAATTIIGDYTECSIASGKNKNREIIEYFKKKGIQKIIITFAGNGSIAHSMRQTVSVKAVLAKKIIDSTGAGDSYLAGFLAAQGKNYTLKDSMKFASLVATRCIENKGPLDELTEYIYK